MAPKRLRDRQGQGGIAHLGHGLNEFGRFPLSSVSRAAPSKQAVFGMVMKMDEIDFFAGHETLDGLSRRPNRRRTDYAKNQEREAEREIGSRRTWAF